MGDSVWMTVCLCEFFLNARHMTLNSVFHLYVSSCKTSHYLIFPHQIPISVFNALTTEHFLLFVPLCLLYVDSYLPIFT